MATVVTTTAATIEVSPCEDVVITDHELGEDGFWVREFRFYGEALTEDGDVPLVLTISIKSQTKTKLDANAPAQTF